MLVYCRVVSPSKRKKMKSEKFSPKPEREESHFPSLVCFKLSFSADEMMLKHPSFSHSLPTTTPLHTSQVCMLFANIVVKVATVTPYLAWIRWCTFMYFSMAGLIEVPPLFCQRDG